MSAVRCQGPGAGPGPGASAEQAWIALSQVSWSTPGGGPAGETVDSVTPCSPRQWANPPCSVAAAGAVVVGVVVGVLVAGAVASEPQPAKPRTAAAARTNSRDRLPITRSADEPDEAGGQMGDQAAVGVDPLLDIRQVAAFDDPVKPFGATDQNTGTATGQRIGDQLP